MKYIKGIFPFVFFAFTLTTGVPASGQTDYSMRMRTMGIVLSGILDDAVTDAYRNPARIGGMGASQLYVGYFPSRSFILGFPVLESGWFYDRSPLPVEQLNSAGAQVSFYPLSFSFFTTVGESTPLSVTFETSADGYEWLDTDAVISFEGYEVFDDVSQEEMARPQRSNRAHFLLDVAVAGSVPENESRSTGARLTVRYDTCDRLSGDSGRNIFFDLDTPTELEYDSNSRLYDWGYEETEACLKAGVFRPGSRLRELVAGAGYTRETGYYTSRSVRVYDEDYDGNGRDPAGFMPTYSYDGIEFESNRDYREIRGFGSLVLEWGERVRSKHSVSWSEGRGDGGATYRLDDEFYGDVAVNLLNENIDYEYDGKRRQYYLSSTVGFFQEVYEGVTVAAGVRARYHEYEFDEDGDGTAGGRLTQDDSTYALESPYNQNVAYRSQSWALIAPVSMEWEVASFFTFRLGLFFDASRSDSKNTRRQGADVASQTFSINDLSRLEERDIEYQTDVNTVLGFQLKVKDRLFIDFYDTYAGDFGFSYISARYLF